MREDFLKQRPVATAVVCAYQFHALAIYLIPRSYSKLCDSQRRLINEHKN